VPVTVPVSVPERVPLLVSLGVPLCVGVTVPVSLEVSLVVGVTLCVGVSDGVPEGTTWPPPCRHDVRLSAAKHASSTSLVAPLMMVSRSPMQCSDGIFSGRPSKR